MSAGDEGTREERDYLGAVEVPAKAYYGAQTQRAVHNFPISGLKVHPHLIHAAGCVKRTAAMANAASGRLQVRIAEAIISAAEDVASGNLDDQFVVDVFQSGAGVSFHMNVNEVIANRAVEILGGTRGDYELVHPNDHVNLGQSTNDVVPTSMRLAALELLREAEPAFQAAVREMRARATDFASIVKAGRTHMMDAVPLTLGQEVGGYAAALERAIADVKTAASDLHLLGLGASAVGTGFSTFPGYRELVVGKLCAITGFDLLPAPDLFEATQSMAPFAFLSAALKTLALEMIRIANDLRLLASGPAAGLAEIHLPALQPGSSLMPGKVNPVVPEMIAMVGFQVVGNDTAITLAVQAGQLELNVMMPCIAHNLLQSIEILKNSLQVFADKCLVGLTADEKRCAQFAEVTPGLGTILNTLIGYHRASEVVRRAIEERRSLRDVAVELGYLSAEDANTLLSPQALLGPERGSKGA